MTIPRPLRKLLAVCGSLALGLLVACLLQPTWTQPAGLPPPGAGVPVGGMSVMPGMVTPGTVADGSTDRSAGSEESQEATVAIPAEGDGAMSLLRSIIGSPAEAPPATASVSADLRRRLEDAARLGRAAGTGDATAVHERDRLATLEPDPRVRATLASGAIPPLGESVDDAPILPVAQAPAEPMTLEGYWGSRPNELCETSITVGADGRAIVETRMTEGSGGWHVRYGGWAWRDVDGNTVIDSRGQTVEYLDGRDGGWSPDSILVHPGGTLDTIDDRHQAGQGATAQSGAG
jgi:hypothetical protein